METSPPPHLATNLSTHLYYQVVYTLTDLLPPPLDDSFEALNTRNRAAIAKVASLLPVNANEVDLAAQCIAARAQAEDLLRLLRKNADDIQLVIRLNAQYSSMVRTSLSVHARLMRVQAVRHKREAIEGAANQDAWTQHIAEQSMLKVTDPHIERPKPAAREDQSSDENALKLEQNLMARVLRRSREGAPEPEAQAIRHPVSARSDGQSPSLEAEIARKSPSAPDLWSPSPRPNPQMYPATAQ